VITALLLLCSCSPVAPAIPSSLPFVRVDPELTGAVISREAAIAVASRRIDDKARCDVRVTDCQARAQSAEQALAEQTKRAESSSWWRVWGPGLVAGIGSLGLVLGVVATVLAIGVPQARSSSALVPANR